jgi:hypothetical protein
MEVVVVFCMDENIEIIAKHFGLSADEAVDVSVYLRTRELVKKHGFQRKDTGEEKGDQLDSTGYVMDKFLTDDDTTYSFVKDIENEIGKDKLQDIVECYEFLTLIY